MKDAADVEQDLLALPPIERAQLLLRAWASIADDPSVAADPGLDAHGLELAAHRDSALYDDAEVPIDEAEFRRRTGTHELGSSFTRPPPPNSLASSSTTSGSDLDLVRPVAPH